VTKDPVKALQDLISSSSLRSKDKINKMYEIMKDQNLDPNNLNTPNSVDPTFIANSLKNICRADCNLLECVSVMRKCACDKVLRAGLLILRNHVMRNQNMLLKAVAGMERVPELVVASLKRYPEDRTIACRAFKCVIDLCQRSIAPQNARDFRRLDMMSHILSAMQKWRKDEELCGDALGALRALILENVESEKRLASKFNIVMDFRDEYPATVIGFHQQSSSSSSSSSRGYGIGKYLFNRSTMSSSSSSSHDEITHYHLLYDDSYEDKRVAYYNIRAQSEDEQTRYVEPASHKDKYDDNNNKKKKLKKNKKMNKKLVCTKVHELVRYTRVPPTYKSGCVLCDVCGKNDLVRSCKFFSHCSTCKYDLCDKCSETISTCYPSSCSSIDFEVRVGTKHRLFKWGVLLLNAMVHSREDVLKNDQVRKMIESLNVAATRAAGSGHLASRVLNRETEFKKNSDLITQQGRLFLRRSLYNSSNIDRMFPRLVRNEAQSSSSSLSPSNRLIAKETKEQVKSYTQNHLFRKMCSVVGMFGSRHFSDEKQQSSGSTLLNRQPGFLYGELMNRSELLGRGELRTKITPRHKQQTDKKKKDTLEVLLANTDESHKIWKLLVALKTIIAIQSSRRCVWKILCEDNKSSVVVNENAKALLKLGLQRKQGVNDLNNYDLLLSSDLPIEFFHSPLTTMIAESQHNRTARFLKAFDSEEILRLCAEDIRAAATKETTQITENVVTVPNLEMIFIVLSSLSQTNSLSKLAKSKSMEVLLDSLRDALLLGRENSRLVHFAIRIVRVMLSTTSELFQVVTKSLRLDSHLLEKIVTEIERLELRNSKLHSRYSQDLFDTLVNLRTFEDDGEFEREARDLNMKKKKKIRRRIEMRCTQGHRLEFCPLQSNVCDVCRSNGVRKSGTAYRCGMFMLFLRSVARERLLFFASLSLSLSHTHTHTLLFYLIHTHSHTASGCDYDVCEACWEEFFLDEEEEEEEGKMKSSESDGDFVDESQCFVSNLKISSFENLSNILYSRKNILNASRTLVCPIVKEMNGMYDGVTRMLRYPLNSKSPSSQINASNFDHVVEILRCSKKQSEIRQAATLLDAMLKAWKHVDVKMCENVETKNQLILINSVLKSNEKRLLSITMEMLMKKKGSEKKLKEEQEENEDQEEEDEWVSNSNPKFRRNESVLIRFNESMISQNQTNTQQLKDIAEKLANDMRRRMRPKPPAAALQQLAEFGVGLTSLSKNTHTHSHIYIYIYISQ